MNRKRVSAEGESSEEGDEASAEVEEVAEEVATVEAHSEDGAEVLIIKGDKVIMSLLGAEYLFGGRELLFTRDIVFTGRDSRETLATRIDYAKD